ncbi:NAD(P)-binding protein [Daldinia decipiens]|uniref:NAD(P)-binding protein n=1 Tax=Daldinia decipiens TaxID=326647 RepID=UPI0020C58934|nr:NAD(P)-binding protein [Daldinia decipiens]KAI1652961.1 NAD(P)-binding protein [Daldinia decipiens]
MCPASTALTEPLPGTVHFLDADLSKPHFGLSNQTYLKLLNEVTIVIHNAWQVNFNLSIDSFVGQIRGVQQIIEFSAFSRFGARLFFISSISAVTGRPGVVPEYVYKDWQTAGTTGYGESKLVAERMLSTAAEEAEIPVVICRIGQVAGPTTKSGVWPRQEWLPSLIASSKYMGKLPMSLNRMEVIDWIPVDLLGKSIVELAVHPANPQSNGAVVYHTVNPQQTTWEALLPTVTRCLDSTGKMEVVPLDAWVRALRDSARKTDDLSANSAVKLIEFYEGLSADNIKQTQLDTEKAVQASATLGSLGPVHEAWMENWIRQWAS